jgi:hypothetical protein
MPFSKAANFDVSGPAPVESAWLEGCFNTTFAARNEGSTGVFGGRKWLNRCHLRTKKKASGANPINLFDI